MDMKTKKKSITSNLWVSNWDLMKPEIYHLNQMNISTTHTVRKNHMHAYNEIGCIMIACNSSEKLTKMT